MDWPLVAVVGVVVLGAVVVIGFVLGRRRRTSEPAPGGAPATGDARVRSAAVEPQPDQVAAAPEQETAPAAGPAPEPAAEATPDPMPEPAPEPAAEPVVTPEPEPVATVEPDPRSEPAPEPAAEPTPEPVAAAAEPAPVAAAESKPESEPEPEPVAEPAAAAPADDLRRIEGIGPKMANALQTSGIRTYRQLADSDEASLRAAVKAAGMRVPASLPTWPKRAAELADSR